MAVHTQDALASKILDVALYPVFVVLAMLTFNYVNQQVDYEFIDEVFHITQCQKYCSRIFHDWDPKITTPPGLYVLGYAYAEFVRALGFEDHCGLSSLRTLNYIGGVFVLPMVLNVSAYPAWQFPVSNLVSFPLLTVYYCLFYTDIWATIFVLFSLVAVLGGAWNTSALLGLVSITFRQTNVVWNAFVVVYAVDQNVRRKYSSRLVQDVTVFVKGALANWAVVLPFVFNAGLFLAFVYYNGGITLGDKENHSVGIHLVQVLYCATFMCAFSLPVWASPAFLKNYVRSNFGSPLRALAFIAAISAIIWIIDNYTIVHPFLLADNRHYIFYIWKRIIGRSPNSKFFLAPIYHFSVYTVMKLGSASEQFTWISLTAFVGAVCVAIVPSPLFEPRYYITPFIVWRMFVTPSKEPIVPFKWFKDHNNTIRLVAEFVYFNCINAIVFYVFLTYTFEWPSDPGILQRIIW